MTKQALYELVAQATVRKAEVPEGRQQRSALTIGVLAVTAATFGVYWLTAVVLASRHAAGHFGADASFFAVLADMAVHHRAARFHPVTTTLGLAWMKTFAPLLTPWLAPATILKAMFAAVGALGVWAAMSIFTVLLPRGYVLLGGILYACSLGVWYFAGIPESKIVTATLSVLYIALYVRLLRFGKPGELYNVCGGRSYSVRELLQTMIERTGRAISIVERRDSRRSGDLADIYGYGKAELALGEVLRQRPHLRNKIVIQSKCGDRFREGGIVDNSREHIVSSVAGSLKRLGVDHLDVLLLHWPDTLVEPEEVAQAIVWLGTASPEYLNGATIDVNDGAYPR